MRKHISIKAIHKLVDNALNCLFTIDSYLLINDANERAITHRLACYLQTSFPEWDVDCEYNRNHDQAKRLHSIASRNAQMDNTNGKTVFPDIIVHKRGTNNNLLVIEVKKSTNRETEHFDFAKLDAYKNELNYKFALFIKLLTGNSTVGIQDYIWK